MKKIWILILIPLLIPGFLIAETIGNYAGCKVCHGSIYYTAIESIEILGAKGYAYISELRGSNSKVKKIDLDGLLKSGSLKTPDQGYELRIWWGNEVFYIKDLIDGSLIEIYADHKTTLKADGYKTWQPKIYISSLKAEKIDLKDTMDIAWQKVKKSGIYFWVSDGNKKGEWKDQLSNKILQSFELFAQ